MFVDEAYFEYVNAKDYPDSLKLLKSHKNVVVTRTFSKMYGLAGLRVGYGIARSEVIDILNRVREPFNVNSLAQSAALAALKDQVYYRRIAKEIEQQRHYLYAQLERLNVDYKKTATNFILIDVKKDSRRFTQGLMKKGVIVRDMRFWGLNSYIRMSIGTPTENRKFIAAFKKLI